MLNEIRQKQKKKVLCDSIYNEESKIVKLMETESRMVVVGLGEAGSGSCSMSIKFQLCRINKFYRSVQHSALTHKYCIIH